MATSLRYIKSTTKPSAKFTIHKAVKVDNSNADKGVIKVKVSRKITKKK